MAIEDLSGQIQGISGASRVHPNETKARKMGNIKLRQRKGRCTCPLNSIYMYLVGKLVLGLAVLGGVLGQTGTPTALTPAESSAALSASAAAATASTSSHTSNVKGAAFNHFYQIWLENTVLPQLNCSD